MQLHISLLWLRRAVLRKIRHHVFHALPLLHPHHVVIDRMASVLRDWRLRTAGCRWVDYSAVCSLQSAVFLPQNPLLIQIANELPLRFAIPPSSGFSPARKNRHARPLTRGGVRGEILSSPLRG